MSRIPLIDATTAPLKARTYFASGNPGPLVSTFAHVPEMLEKTTPFLKVMFGQSAIPMRLKEIVILRASARLFCKYCTETHLVEALEAGLSRDEVIALRSPDPAEVAFSDPREKALVRWTDLLTSANDPIPENETEAIQDKFSEAELVELTLLAGATIMLNRYATAFALPTSPKALGRLAKESLT